MRGRDDQDRRGERDSRDTRQTGHRNEAEGRATEEPRIRARMTALSRRGSRCHPLNSSQLFNCFKGSSGLGLRGER